VIFAQAAILCSQIPHTLARIPNFQSFELSGFPPARDAAGLARFFAHPARARFLLGASSAAAPALAARAPLLARAELAHARFLSVKPAGSPPGAQATMGAAESASVAASAGTAPAFAAPRAESASPGIALNTVSLSSLDFTVMRQNGAVIVDKTGAIADLLAKRAVSARAIFTRPRK
jgi:hypothetical protein